MTEEEKKTAAEQKQREMEEMMRQAQESYRQEYASIPYDGPVYGCRREELMLPMQDGVRLYTEIFKPEGLAQFPVLIQRSCYPNQQPLYEINGVELTRRGYGYVVQTCRGTGKSEGHWEPNVNERPDGRDTLQWLNDQPWAESIGYFGASYLALTGWAIADIVPPKVKGMMLTVYGTDRFKSAYEKGLFRHDVLTGWAMQNAGHPVTADYLESCRFRPHDKVDEALWGGNLDWYQDWIHATRRTDAYWQQGWWKLLADVPGNTKFRYISSMPGTITILAVPSTRMPLWPLRPKSTAGWISAAGIICPSPALHGASSTIWKTATSTGCWNGSICC